MENINKGECTNLETDAKKEDSKKISVPVHLLPGLSTCTLSLIPKQWAPETKVDVIELARTHSLFMHNIGAVKILEETNGKKYKHLSLSSPKRGTIDTDNVESYLRKLLNPPAPEIPWNERDFREPSMYDSEIGLPKAICTVETAKKYNNIDLLFFLDSNSLDSDYDDSEVLNSVNRLVGIENFKAIFRDISEFICDKFMIKIGYKLLNACDAETGFNFVIPQELNQYTWETLGIYGNKPIKYTMEFITIINPNKIISSREDIIL